MIISFTGTRHGLTKGQIETLRSMINRMDDVPALIFHHGGAVGADTQFHEIVSLIYNDNVKITIHPGPSFNPNHLWRGLVFIKPIKPNLVRNQDLVDVANQLIACPNSDRERTRSGTWSTIRKAKKKKMLITIIYPDGRTLKTWGKQRSVEVKKNQYRKAYGG